jgi:hypothetical protein
MYKTLPDYSNEEAVDMNRMHREKEKKKNTIEIDSNNMRL